MLELKKINMPKRILTNIIAMYRKFISNLIFIRFFVVVNELKILHAPRFD
jgi:hypothetical protein